MGQDIVRDGKNICKHSKLQENMAALGTAEMSCREGQEGVCKGTIRAPWGAFLSWVLWADWQGGCAYQVWDRTGPGSGVGTWRSSAELLSVERGTGLVRDGACAPLAGEASVRAGGLRPARPGSNFRSAMA